MIYTSSSNYYNLELPKSWKIEENHDTVSFYNPINGFGAINISSYKIPKEYLFDVRHELIQFVKEYESLDNIEVQDIKGKKIAHLQLDQGKSFWLYYVLYSSNKALFVTYNCDYVDKEKELALVNLIISSIEIN